MDFKYDLGLRCPSCGSVVEKKAAFCPKCGQQIRREEAVREAPPTGKTATGATASLVCGIIGLVFFGVILGSLAVAFSIQAKRLIRQSPHLGGAGRATAGLTLGIADICLFIIGLVLIFAV